MVNDLTVGERTVSNWLDDMAIRSKIRSALLADSDVKVGDIDVGSSQGVVTLIGRVSSESIRNTAETAARCVYGVKDVHNELSVGEKSHGETRP